MKKLNIVVLLILLSLIAFFAGRQSVAPNIYDDAGSDMRKTTCDLNQRPSLSETMQTTRANKPAALNCDAQIAEALSSVGKTSLAVNNTEGTQKAELKQLELVVQDLAQRYRSVSIKLEDAYRSLEEAGIEVEQAVTAEQINENLTAPFNTIVNSAGMAFKEQYGEFLNEEQDFDWAIQLETRISDFIKLHTLSQEIQLSSVQCRASKCEMYGFETSNKPFDTIMRDMKTQDWYQDSGSYSMSGDSIPTGQPADSQFSGYFYSIVSFPRQ
ncbi:hypothetical protein ACFO4O_13555 [Glaciecola siphonariae]|uniref:Uncharacterized protein n=1 Tax=Glaciecola siphonariae TaxID=521012 RepID=A0ABV9M0H0_9ALTE